MNRGTWWATVHGVKKSDMTEQINKNNEEYDPRDNLFGSCKNCNEEVREEASMYVILGKGYMQPST